MSDKVTHEAHDKISQIALEHFKETGVMIDRVNFEWVESMGGAAAITNTIIEGHKR